MADLPPGELIVSQAEVAAGLDRLAAQIQPVVSAHPCTLVGVMTGGMYPLMQLVTRLNGDFLIDYCHATRYAGAIRGGKLEWRVEPRLPLTDRIAIVVDDIFDEGHTLAAIRQLCASLGAAEVYTAVLAVKNIAGVDRAKPDFTSGIIVPNRYVFGCGMDLNEAWRHLDAIYAVPEVVAANGRES
jgi:hypoxanthine phosphoribosyltransferase